MAAEDQVKEVPPAEEAKADEAAKADEPMQEEEKKEEEVPKEPEGPKELEADAAADSRPKVAAGSVALNAQDSTLNFLPIAGTQLCTSMSEGGMQYLLAGARATAGIKSGRYMFEARIVEQLDPAELPGQGRAPAPRQLLRVGLSTAASSLFLGTSEDSICFDSEAGVTVGKKRSPLKQKVRFGKSTVAVLVNLDAGSPNANTVSLFIDGERASEPQAIPQALLGKALFPTITYRNVTVEVNFGPVRTALPFKCHTVAEAAKADVEEKQPAKPKDGKYEVVFPVGLPEKGYFDWVDSFVAKNPGYTELSDRAIIQWATKSGFPSVRNAASNDQPSMAWGVGAMDNGSVRSVLTAIAPCLQRNLVIAEVRGNLVADDRQAMLASYAAPHFKKNAMVFLGEPSKEYVSFVHDLMLSEKKQASDKKKEAKTKELERKRLLEEKKKKAEEAKRARLAAERKKAGKEEEVEEEKKAAEPEEKEPEAMDVDGPVELTEEEKATKIRKTARPDLTEAELSKYFAKFTVPTKEEGFDNVNFVWEAEAAAKQLLEKFVKDQKLTQKVQGLKPSPEFKEKLNAWTKQVAEWKRRQTEWKDPSKKKALIAKKKEALKGEDGEEKELPEIDLEELDVMAVEDVMDIGNAAPLFATFEYEDWQLLSARYELSLLLHSFKKDLNDPDRPSFPADHLSHYYNIYYRKQQPINEACGYKEVGAFVNLIKENITVSATGILEVQMPEDTPPSTFLKLVEDHRRDRERRVDAGDESALLKFTRRPTQPSSGPPASARPGPGGRPATPAARPPARQAGAITGVKRSAPAPAPGAPAWKSARPSPSGAGSFGGRPTPTFYGRR
eukprot:TRINITY_DN4977_c0_g1_i13.p1 TRINITY_DN4977_c0_g1~~TRINITY_DN4977_c0_g1_i13.p1  ORF type:complete len:843 (+),score=339.05 TRINITY_DN4977_c0_g1_i13:81-2609(+)